MRPNEGWDGFFPTKDDFIDMPLSINELEALEYERYLYEMGRLNEMFDEEFDELPF